MPIASKLTLCPGERAMCLHLQQYMGSQMGVQTGFRHMWPVTQGSLLRGALSNSFILLSLRLPFASEG